MAHVTGVPRKGVVSDPLDQAGLVRYMRVVAFAAVELGAAQVQMGGQKGIVLAIMTVEALVRYAARQQGGVLALMRLVTVQAGAIGGRFMSLPGLHPVLEIGVTAETDAVGFVR